MTEHRPPLIDLSAAADACRPLVTWWRNWESTGRADPAGLDAALRQLDTCPPLPGRLGHAVAILDRDALAHQRRPVLLAALAQLERLVDIGPRPCQLVFPGLDLTAPPQRHAPDNPECGPASSTDFT